MKYLVFGRIDPERVAATFGHIIAEAEGQFRAEVNCDASQLNILIDFQDATSTHLDAYMTASRVAEMATSSFGFVLGSGYACEMVSVINELGQSTVFGVRPTDDHGMWLGLAQNSSDIASLFDQTVELSKRDPYFRMAVRDYTTAIRDHLDCPVYCYRAIESLKNSFGSWELFHSTLGTTRMEISRKVKTFADAQRHGNWLEMKPHSGAERFAMLEATRDVLVLYAQYRGTNPANQSKDKEHA